MAKHASVLLLHKGVGSRTLARVMVQRVQANAHALTMQAATAVPPLIVHMQREAMDVVATPVHPHVTMVRRKRALAGSAVRLSVLAKTA